MRRDKPKRIAWVETGRVPRQLTTLGTSRCKDCRRSSFGCSQLITWALPPSTLQMAPHAIYDSDLCILGFITRMNHATPYLTRLMVIFYFFSWLIFFYINQRQYKVSLVGGKKNKVRWTEVKGQMSRGALKARSSDKFLSFEKLLEMSHLPSSHH